MTLAHLGAKDMLRLALASRRFGGKWKRNAPAAATAAQQQPAPRSLVEDFAARWMATRSATELAWVPNSSGRVDLDVMHEIELLLEPRFSRSHMSIALLVSHTVAQKRPHAARMPLGPSELETTLTAATAGGMRAGCHFAEFTLLTANQCTYLGAAPESVRLQVPAAQKGSIMLRVSDGSYCKASASSLTCDAERVPWVGMRAAGVGDRIGMLLDVDAGSITVYVNGERLGVMVTKCHSGSAMCWAVGIGNAGDKVQIRSHLRHSTADEDTA
jgi:hypothetical protein